MMSYTIRPADEKDSKTIWNILQGAIKRRKVDGSNQWQDGYPNPTVIAQDIAARKGYVIIEQNNIAGYICMAINDEPEYDNIVGSWLTVSDYVVFHRVAIAEAYLGKGLAKFMMHFIEDFAIKNGVNSIKADTNFDNPAMLHLFESSGYAYCGKVYFRGSERLAYEKVLTHDNG